MSALTFTFYALFLVSKTRCEGDFIPDNYSSDVPPIPVAEDGRHHVNISIQFINFMDVNELAGFIQFSCFFRVLWIDSRLGVQNISRNSPLRIPESVADLLWRPDVVTENVRQVVRNGIIKPTIYTGRFWGQTMFVSKYLSLRIGCSFQYQGYPLDVQMCRLHFTDMGMTTDDIYLGWNIPSYMMEPNTFLTFQDRFKMRLCEDKRNPVRRTKLGQHPQKTLFIVMERNHMTYVVQLFLPSILFVLIAWLSILVPPTMLRTRLLLNSTNLLTVLSMFVAVSHAEATYIPKVSYLTALSLWMFVCVAFVFSSMLVVIFDIRLITMLTQPREKQRVRRLVLGVYQRRRSTRQGLQSAADLVQEEEDENASIAAELERRRQVHHNSIKDEDGDLFLDASSQSVTTAGTAEKKEVEGRLRHRRHLWLELTAFYERMYLVAFPSLFCVFLTAFFWYYRRRKRLGLEQMLDIVRASDDSPNCWCTEHDDWPGCMAHGQ